MGRTERRKSQRRKTYPNDLKNASSSPGTKASNASIRWVAGLSVSGIPCALGEASAALPEGETSVVELERDSSDVGLPALGLSSSVASVGDKRLVRDGSEEGIGVYSEVKFVVGDSDNRLVSQAWKASWSEESGVRVSDMCKFWSHSSEPMLPRGAWVSMSGKGGQRLGDSTVVFAT